MMVKRGRAILRQKNLKLNKKNNWPPRSAVLAVIHDRDRFSLVVLHK